MISLTNDDLADISQRMHELYPSVCQGVFEWLLIRAVSDVKQVNVFATADDAILLENITLTRKEITSDGDP